MIASRGAQGAQGRSAGAERSRRYALEIGRNRVRADDSQCAGVERKGSGTRKNIVPAAVVEIQGGVVGQGESARMGKIAAERQASESAECQRPGAAGGPRVSSHGRSAAPSFADAQSLREHRIARSRQGADGIRERHGQLGAGAVQVESGRIAENTCGQIDGEVGVRADVISPIESIAVARHRQRRRRRRIDIQNRVGGTGQRGAGALGILIGKGERSGSQGDCSTGAGGVDAGDRLARSVEI